MYIYLHLVFSSQNARYSDIQKSITTYVTFCYVLSVILKKSLYSNYTQNIKIKNIFNVKKTRKNMFFHFLTLDLKFHFQ